MANYAYVRVSTKEQNIDRQLAALEPYNIPKKNIFCDYQSGKDFDRPAYQKMLKRLKSGEILREMCWYILSNTFRKYQQYPARLL